MCRLPLFTLLHASFLAVAGNRWWNFRPLGKGREGSATVSKESLLERVTAAAEARHLSRNTLTAYCSLPVISTLSEKLKKAETQVLPSRKLSKRRPCKTKY